MLSWNFQCGHPNHFPSWRNISVSPATSSTHLPFISQPKDTKVKNRIGSCSLNFWSDRSWPRLISCFPPIFLGLPYLTEEISEHSIFFILACCFNKRSNHEFHGGHRECYCSNGLLFIHNNYNISFRNYILTHWRPLRFPYWRFKINSAANT